MNYKKIGVFVLSLLLLSPAAVALAQPGQVGGGTEAGPSDVDDLLDLIGQIAVLFQVLVLIIAVIMLVYAGFLWMTAGGEEDKLSTARKVFIWALIGIAVALFAFIAQNFVEDFINRT